MSLPVTRTAGMSLDGITPKSKLLRKARKAAWRLAFGPLETVVQGLSVTDSIRPRSASLVGFLPCAAGLRASLADRGGEGPERYSAVQ